MTRQQLLNTFLLLWWMLPGVSTPAAFSQNQPAPFLCQEITFVDSNTLRIDFRAEAVQYMEGLQFKFVWDTDFYIFDTVFVHPIPGMSNDPAETNVPIPGELIYLWAPMQGGMLDTNYSSFHVMSLFLQKTGSDLGPLSLDPNYSEVVLNHPILGLLDFNPVSDSSLFGCSGFAKITGNLYIDAQVNCVLDSTEAPIPNYWVKAVGDNGVPFYIHTDSVGQYSFSVDSGNYTLTIPDNQAFPYWTACVDSLHIGATSYDSCYQADVGFEPAIFCPLMWVDLASTRMRPCSVTAYTVAYCNQGTVDAADAQVEIQLDSLIQVDSASVSWISLPDNTYLFDFGDVQPFTCGEIKIYTTISCDAQITQTLCVSAHAYPDTICVVDSNWTGASVAITGSCEGDSLLFKIDNVGNGDMDQPSAYHVIEDQVVMMQDTFTLPQGDSLILYVPSNGATFRMVAEQVPFHPGLDYPTVAIEGCGGLGSTGFVMQFPENEQNPFQARHCGMVRGAFDPNEKLANPVGVGSDHFISEDTRLEYVIHFQNLGNDTAFSVIIRDTLSSHLDVETIQFGASSHPFEARVNPGQNLEINFPGIELPDSLINEEGSKGFVQFHIRQKMGNPIGSIIHNQASIYFDTNDPVKTNTTWHTIGEDFLTILIPTSATSNPVNSHNLVVYPNPSTNWIQFQVDGVPGEKEIILFNVLGRELARHTFAEACITIPVFPYREQVLVYQCHTGGRLIGTGKLILNR